jgi:membrane protease YdiL (CAAX protease family)
MMDQVPNMLLVLIFGIVVTVGINGWFSAICCLRSGGPLLAAERSSPPPLGLFDLLGFFLLQMLGDLWAGWSAGIDVSSPNDASATQQLSMLYHLNFVRLGLFAVGTLWLWGRYRSLVPAFSSQRFGSDLLLGCRAFCMIAPIVYTLQVVLSLIWKPSQHPIIALLQDADNRAQTLAVCGIAAVIAAPLFEELIFRRFLYGWLCRVATVGSDEPVQIFVGGVRPGGVTAEPELFEEVENERIRHDAEKSSDDASNPYRPTARTTDPGTTEPKVTELETTEPETKPATRGLPWWPLWVSSGLFALMHAGTGPDPIPLFVFAIWLAYIYRQTGRLTPCIVIHLLLNLISFLLLSLSTAA